MTRQAIAIALVALCGCLPLGSVPRDSATAHPSFQLLRATKPVDPGSADSGSFLNEIRVGELQAHLVAKGETPYFERRTARAWLSGSADGTDGFWVDTFILLEVMDEAGRVLKHVAVGYTDPLVFGSAQVESLGRRSFHFDAKEIEVTGFLPEQGRVKVLGTVFSYLGAGKVSDVFITLDAAAPRAESSDLRER